MVNNKFALPIVDECSTSAKKSGSHMRRVIMALRTGKNPEILFSANNFPELRENSHCQVSSEPSAVSNYSTSAISEPGSATLSSDQKTKRCNFPGCAKGARGSTGICIGHGGGQRCQKAGCDKGAESRTVFCKTHGGGKRCQQLGCTKCAEGKTDHCIAHGGGKPRRYLGGCTKAAMENRVFA